jgi:hypothetical protein
MIAPTATPTSIAVAARNLCECGDSGREERRVLPALARAGSVRPAACSSLE